MNRGTMTKTGSPTVWRRACYGEANCVEIADTADGMLMRDSKLADSPILGFSLESWSGFVAGVRAGEFD